MKLIKESWNFGGFTDNGSGIIEYISSIQWFRIKGLKEAKEQSNRDPSKMGWPCYNYKVEKLTKQQSLYLINSASYDSFYKLYKL